MAVKTQTIAFLCQNSVRGGCSKLYCPYGIFYFIIHQSAGQDFLHYSSKAPGHNTITYMGRVMFVAFPLFSSLVRQIINIWRLHNDINSGNISEVKMLMIIDI